MPTVILPALASQDAPDLCFTDSELLGNRTLRGFAEQGANFCNLLVGQFNIECVFSDFGRVHTSTRAKRIPEMILSRLGEPSTAGRASLYGWWSDPVRVSRASHMMPRMVRAPHYFKIIWRVVQLVAVQMVDKFRLVKHPTKLLAHNKPMLKDVSALARVGMIRRSNQPVSAFCFCLASIPSRVSASALMMTGKISDIRASLHTPKRYSGWVERLSATAFALNHVSDNSSQGATMETL